MNNMKDDVIEEVRDVLKALGYLPRVDYENNCISFVSHGFENFRERHKAYVRAMLGDRLLEFDYGNNTQNIYFAEKKSRVPKNIPIVIDRSKNEYRLGIKFGDSQVLFYNHLYQKWMVIDSENWSKEKYELEKISRDSLKPGDIALFKGDDTCASYHDTSDYFLIINSELEVFVDNDSDIRHDAAGGENEASYYKVVPINK
jgi:hypothetical protein